MLLVLTLLPISVLYAYFLMTQSKYFWRLGIAKKRWGRQGDHKNASLILTLTNLYLIVSDTFMYVHELLDFIGVFFFAATENPPQGGSGANKSITQYLHLNKSFYEVIRDSNYGWQRLPICKSLLKLRLENTKVKGDGASVVLECCPNIFSLGYLVFAAAGLKQVYGYEDLHETKFTEIFYRGPSDQKLQTIANTCKKLRTMFLGT